MGILAPSTTARRRLKFKRRRSGKRLAVQCTMLLVGFVCILAYAKLWGQSESGLANGGRALLSSSSKCDENATAIPHESHYPSSELLGDSVPLQLLLMLYMFVGLAAVCDEYFESSLDAICQFLNLSDDVAGATFMAAGSSAPELFTSVMGVFVATSDVGVGTIVGSAVFNVLIIIGICALAAPNIKLSWWPLVRDSSYYCLTIVTLVIIVFNQEVLLHESIICLVLYVLYIVLMWLNSRLEPFVVRLKETKDDRIWPGEGLVKRFATSDIFGAFIAVIIVANLVFLIYELSTDDSDAPEIFIANIICSVIFILEFVLKVYGLGWFGYWEEPSNSFDGVLVFLIIGEFMLGGQSSISNIRTLRLFRVFRVLRTLRCIKLVANRTVQHKVAVARASLVHSSPPVANADNKQNKIAPVDSNKEEADLVKTDEETGDKEKLMEEDLKNIEKTMGDDMDIEKGTKLIADEEDKKEGENGEDGEDNEDDDDDDEPTNPFEVPDTITGKISWIICLPITIPMYFTIPDCRSERFKKWFFVTFGMSIVWIAALSFIMVWMAELFGIIADIPPPVMGLTILAAGTSIPDTIASVSVAKQGKGDMAISNSIGSNIFDILIGLGLPWFIKTAFQGETVYIYSDSLTVSVMILFITVALVILSIHFSGWILSKKIGYMLLFAYVLYVVQALLTEYGIILSNC